MELESAQRFQSESLQHSESLSNLLAQAATLVQAGRADEALELYRTGHQNLQAFANRWDAELRRGDPSFAEWWRQYMVEQEVSLLTSEGMALRWMGRTDDASLLFEHALALTSSGTVDHAGVLQSIGGIRFDQQRFAEAEEFCRRAHAEYAALADNADSDFSPGDLRSNAAHALAEAAHAALGRGSYADFEKNYDEAISFAEHHDLLDLADKLWLKQAGVWLGVDASGETIQRVDAELKRRCARRDDPEFRWEALQLMAGSHLEQGQPDVARMVLEQDFQEEGFQKAYEDKIAPLPLHRQVSLLRQLAAAAEADGDMQAALDYSQHALTVARQIGMPQVIIAALRALVLHHAENNPDEAEKYFSEMRAFGEMEEIKNALLARAWVHLKHERFDLAMRDVDEAERAMPEAPDVLIMRVGVLRFMDDREEELRAVERAAAAYREQIRRSGTDLKPALDALAALHERAAHITAELERTKEAFTWAESGKALRLRSRFVEPTDETGLTDISFSALRERLRAESATLLFFSVMRRRTLALLCDPRFDKPHAFFVDLTEESLAELLPTELHTNVWDTWVFNALPPLSEKLAPCLNEIISCKEDRLLYIVPDAQLYFVPFAALDVGDNSKLIEHRAIAYLPCAAMLNARPQTDGGPRVCLAAGAGSVPEGASEADKIKLSEHAAEIAALEQWDAKKYLPEAKVQDFLDLAPQFRVLHLACHGQIESQSQATRSASFLELSDESLELSDESRLTAKDIHNLTLTSDLVFLNACVSGRFQSRLSNEVGGFWEAFLHAGASRIIVTIAYVHPESAQRLALAFYRHWLNGTPTAEALRQAQLEVRQEKPEPEHWATHILIGVS